MRFKGCCLFIVLALGCMQLARADSFYPPERINCNLSILGELHCANLDRNILKESTTNADLNNDRYDTFVFRSAVAYLFNQEATIYLGYYNFSGKIVRLTTVNKQIHPDLMNTNWKKITDDMYLCQAGYLQCGMIYRS